MSGLPHSSEHGEAGPDSADRMVTGASDSPDRVFAVLRN
jgi:hypothetical protein